MNEYILITYINEPLIKCVCWCDLQLETCCVHTKFIYYYTLSLAAVFHELFYIII